MHPVPAKQSLALHAEPLQEPRGADTRSGGRGGDLEKREPSKGDVDEVRHSFGHDSAAPQPAGQFIADFCPQLLASNPQAHSTNHMALVLKGPNTLFARIRQYLCGYKVV